MSNTVTRPDWGKLFSSILAEPGRLGEYYSLFHSYSLGNQALAMFQMTLRGIPIGPISSFNGWKKLGRRVRKGEKAIALWMPVVKKEVVQKDDGTEEERTRRFFIMKNHWFALAQTEPIDPENPGTVPTPETPEWDRATALANLGITEVPFEHTDGNCQGFARPDKLEIAINPLAAMPWKTTFHEIAHCLLHSKRAEAAFVDGGVIDASIEEAEAEAVAFLCCATLGLPGLEEARGYVQSWLGSSAKAEEFAKKSASRVFAAADKILKAGAASKEEAGDE
ncbi:ArdC-like ssDNA-binding domain-containing protein [Pelomicrobium methylotrophicum]|uniref:ArdC-like ssDNA-binding domain-containing protein n=1 Tax=Pelomicrobium methylotrophicum TaxID=2602750 RepID=UPI001969EE22|nr:ArdC-like ssDNA-binding domain-containing protein [Pelomicrobium methylotrophicum]